MIVKVGSWNIWAFGERDYEGMAELIRENDLDIVGLQEVVTYFEDGEHRNMAEQIAEELGFECVFYPAHDFSETDFEPERNHVMGNAVISRFPISESQSFSLNPEEISYDGSPEKEPRIMINAEINVGGQNLNFLTTHLQYAHKFQTTEISRAQVRNINSILTDLETSIILAGDFNSPLESEEIGILEQRLDRIEDDSPTWTVHPFDYRGWEVDDLEYRVDNIFVSPDVSVVDSQTVRSDLSDHLPVVAKLEID